MDIKNLETLKIHKLTTEQYRRELALGNIDENAIYLTPEEEQELTTKITSSVTDEQIPTAKAVYDAIQDALYVDEGAVI